MVLTQTVTSDDMSLALSEALLVDFDEETEEAEIISTGLVDEVEEGQIYINKHILIEVMQKYALLRQFRFKVVKSCTERLTLKCPDDNCCWFFKSSSLGKSGLFKVRVFNDEYSCSLDSRLDPKRRCSSGVLGGMLLPKYSDTKTIYTPSDIQADMKRNHGISLTHMQAWKGKQKAMKIL